jgi:hypothetical protein
MRVCATIDMHARVFHVTHLCATRLKAVTVSCIRRRHHVRGNHNSLSRPVGACTAIEVSLLHHAAVCVCVCVGRRCLASKFRTGVRALLALCNHVGSSNSTVVQPSCTVHKQMLCGVMHYHTERANNRKGRARPASRW